MVIGYKTPPDWNIKNYLGEPIETIPLGHTLYYTIDGADYAESFSSKEVMYKRIQESLGYFMRASRAEHYHTQVKG